MSGSDPARLGTTATPTEDGEAYLLDGVKLWTTNGVIAELLVVMAARTQARGQPRWHHARSWSRPTHRASPSRTATRSWVCKGIENGVTRFHQVRVPAANRLGKEGEGLKIALTTLNTGRLSIPAMCAAAGKWSLKIAREWSAERVQWGKPVGEHEAVASKLSFIAATTFALEAVLDLSSQLADAGTKDIRIEAALAKLWSSEMSYKIADELVQIRGGRGFETADSLAARGERAVPAEQILRDLRINRIFEGSSEIMRLLIAREAVDAHLKAAAGDLASTHADLQDKAKAAAKASGFYAKWLPQLAVGKGTVPDVVRRVRGAGQAHALRRAVVAQTRPADVLRDEPVAGQTRVPAGVPGQDRRHRRRTVRDGCLLLAGRDDAGGRSGAGQGGVRAGGRFSASRPGCGSRPAVRRALEQHRRQLIDDRGEELLDGEYTWLEDGIIDPSEGTGPWIAHWQPGESKAENVSRRYR